MPVGQVPGYATGLQIQNPTGSTVTAYLSYYRSDGVVALTNTASIAPYQTHTSVDQGPFGFFGSVLVQANAPVRVTTNLLNRTNQTLASANGIASAASQVNLPLLMRNNYGYSTWFAVQNAQQSAVSVTITYYGSASALFSTTVTIPGRASRFFYQSSDQSLPNGYVGSARVTANGPVAVTVIQESSTRLLSYNGFVGNSSSTILNAPMLLANHYGYNSAIQVQNLGGSWATVTVSYAPNSITTQAPNQPAPCTRYPTSRQRSIPSGTSLAIGQNGTEDPQFANCAYVGGARIIADQQIVAIVNQVGTIGASAYEAVNPALTSSRVDLPLLQANHFRVNSGVQIQNIGASGQWFSFTYGPNTAQPAQNLDNYQPCTSLPAIQWFFIQPGEAATVMQQSNFPGCVYVGSATVSGPTGSQVTAIVNQQGGDYMDKLSSYIGR